MSKLRAVSDIRSGKDAIRYAELHGCTVRYGKHTVVSNERGSCAIPCHGSHDLPTGTRKSIIRMLILMGLTVLVAAAIVGI